jgi:uncharacterized protein with PIN domain
MMTDSCPICRANLIQLRVYNSETKSMEPAFWNDEKMWKCWRCGTFTQSYLEGKANDKR